MVKSGKKVIALGAFIAISLPLAAASAATHSANHHHSRHAQAGHRSVHRYAALGRGARVIQCVAFAKQDAGIDISGNARDWWANAAGVYARGARPEPGSVLSFRANGRMPLGHVAVVSSVTDSRTIFIDQSHWNSRGITRDIEVKDVSDDNDWSAVRVQLSRAGSFGSIYPTHGFIYPRPDEGSIVANTTHAPKPVLDEAPADLRPRTHRAAVEVAEAPQSARGLDLTLPGIADLAPSRGLR